MLARKLVLDRRHTAVGEFVSPRPKLVGHGDASRFPARDIAALEHNDLKAALDQLLGGAHSGDATPEDDHSRRHSAHPTASTTCNYTCKSRVPGHSSRSAMLMSGPPRETAQRIRSIDYRMARANAAHASRGFGHFGPAERRA